MRFGKSAMVVMVLILLGVHLIPYAGGPVDRSRNPVPCPISENGFVIKREESEGSTGDPSWVPLAREGHGSHQVLAGYNVVTGDNEPSIASGTDTTDEPGQVEAIPRERGTRLPPDPVRPARGDVGGSTPSNPFCR